MYEWLLEAIEQTKVVGRKYSVNYDFKLNPPATPNQIQEYESKVDLTFPESYKNFLMRYNGAMFFLREPLDFDCIYINRISEIDLMPIDRNFWEEESIVTPEECKILLIGDIWTGEDLPPCFIGLDPYQAEEGSEWKVLSVYRDEKPSGLRRRPLANSFEQWIRRMFNTVLVREENPIYWYYFPVWGGWTKDDTPPSFCINSLDEEEALEDLGKHYYNSLLLEKIGNYEAALKEYELCFSEGRQGENGGSFEARYRLGILRSLVGDQKGALEDFSYTIRYILDLSLRASDEHNPRDWYLGDLDLQFGERYLDLTYPDVCYRRAQIRAELGDIQGAIEDYREAARVYTIKKQDQKAEDSIKKVNQLQ